MDLGEQGERSTNIFFKIGYGMVLEAGQGRERNLSNRRHADNAKLKAREAGVILRTEGARPPRVRPCASDELP